MIFLIDIESKEKFRESDHAHPHAKGGILICVLRCKKYHKKSHVSVKHQLHIVNKLEQNDIVAQSKGSI